LLVKLCVPGAPSGHNKISGTALPVAGSVEAMTAIAEATRRPRRSERERVVIVCRCDTCFFIRAPMMVMNAIDMIAETGRCAKPRRRLQGCVRAVEHRMRVGGLGSKKKPRALLPAATMVEAAGIEPAS